MLNRNIKITCPQVQGLELAYWDTLVNSEGNPSPYPPLLFVHGNSNGKEVFSQQFLSPRLSKYRMIALDLPGHGDSGRIEEAKTNPQIYTIEFYAQVLASFIDQLNLHSRPIVIGHSLGGHVTSLFLKKFPNYLSGLIVFQNPPIEEFNDVSRGFLPHPATEYLFTDSITDKNASQIVDAFFPLHRTPEQAKKLVYDLILKTDPQFRTNMIAAITPESDFGEYSALKSASVPVAIFSSDQDVLISAEYVRSLKFSNLWRGEVIPFQNSGHYIQIDEVELFNQLVDEFIQENFKC